MVSYAAANGSASAGVDYTAASGTVTVPPGATTAPVTVLVQGDTVNEPDETFVLNLSGPVNATIADAQGTAVIRNDDSAVIAGLVAAYGFNEGSGTAVADLSGSNNTGTVSGALWVSGKAGNALSFDGVNDVVTVNDSSSLALTTAMTIEAWVNPRTPSGWRTVVMKERPSGLAYTLYGNTASNQPSVEITTTSGVELRGASALPLNMWTHLAATYDGARIRLYVNGVQTTTVAATGTLVTSASPLRIGGNLVWGEYFDGIIDEMRIYNRALTATEIQTDMNTAVGGGPLPDTTPPVRSNGQPTGTLPAGTTTTTLQITTDEAATCRYGLTAGTSYAAMTNTFATTGGTAHATPISGLNGGSYTYYVRCIDATGNANTSDTAISFSVATSAAGLVAAYGFNEGAGTTLGDSSGNGRQGTIANATWSATGRYGGALLFNGTNAWVTIADATSLRLTTGMTIEAWVQPTVAMGTSWRSVLMKERSGGLSYSLYANGSTSRPSADINTGGVDQTVRGTAAVAANVWTHLAATFNGTTLRLYVNGTLVQSMAVTGSLVTGTGALRLGGNSAWGEWFKGYIDDVRIYNRPLTAAEIVNDMNTPIVP
jgi:hypothetical protein